jgi:NADH-quinone oxidoreductase subunit G
VNGILAKNLKAVLLLNLEPSRDLADPQLASAALAKAGTVIALTAFDSDELRTSADVMLPVAPFTETSGTYLNMEGVAQSVQAAVRPLGEARPAWKIFRVLGNLLNLDGFYFDSSEEVLSEATGRGVTLDNASSVTPGAVSTQGGAIERLADVVIHSSDAIVRRAEALQFTNDAKRGNQVGIASNLFTQLGIQEGDAVKVSQNGLSAVGSATQECVLADNVVRVSAGTALAAQLGAMNGSLTVERA